MGKLFKIADMKKLLQVTDEWMRRCIRMIYWKQWKRVRTKFVRLQTLGIPKQKDGNTPIQERATGESPIAPSSVNPSETTRLKDSDSYSFQITIDKSLRELRNRRIPNGTYGGVGGRLFN
ncbi:hypothetical protein J2T13_000902 [Paenibacillus sp. DS2015]